LHRFLHGSSASWGDGEQLPCCSCPGAAASPGDASTTGLNPARLAEDRGFRASPAPFLGYWIGKIRETCCFTALQRHQHWGHLALQFVLGLLKTRVMQRIILPCSWLVKHPQELAFATEDAAVHLLQESLCRRTTRKMSGTCLRTHFAGKAPYVSEQVN